MNETVITETENPFDTSEGAAEAVQSENEALQSSEGDSSTQAAETPPSAKELVRRLFQARVDYRRANDETTKLLKAFEEEHFKLLQEEKDAKQRVSELELSLRKTAAAEYKAMPEHLRVKKLCPGVSITETPQQTVSYDKEKAIEWAEKNFPAAISKALDTKAVDSFFLTASQRPDFVTVENLRAISVRIDSNLAGAVVAMDEQENSGA